MNPALNILAHKKYDAENLLLFSSQKSELNSYSQKTLKRDLYITKVLRLLL